MTAEIVARLEASFLIDNAPGENLPEEVVDMLADIENLRRKIIHTLLPKK